MASVKGNFQVQMKKETVGPMPGVQRYTMDKVWTGGFVGVSHGEMLAAGDPAKGEAGYVAMERVEGVLEGRNGSFALQHMATMDRGGPKMRVEIVPGSGTELLVGIAGALEILVEGGNHSYVLSYTLA